MKIKIFIGSASIIEKEINEWLQGKLFGLIKTILQSECNNSITISIFYIEGN